MLTDSLGVEIGSVAPEDVHKHSRENLWLDEARLQDDGALIAHFHSPRSMAGARLAELIEVQRQVGIYFAHKVLAVPRDSVFMLAAIALERVRSGRDGQAIDPAGGSVRVRRAEKSAGGSNVSGQPLTFAMESGPHRASGTALVRFIPRGIYDRLRRSAVPPREALLVSTLTPHNGSESLDPLLSDHASDHVSAMASIVSIENEIRRRTSSLLDALSVSFTSYLELEPLPELELSPVMGGSFTGAITQNGEKRVSFLGCVSAPSPTES